MFHKGSLRGYYVTRTNKNMPTTTIYGKHFKFESDIIRVNNYNERKRLEGNSEGVKEQKKFRSNWGMT